MTGLYASSWPKGAISVQITNNGPSTLSGMPSNALSCDVTVDPVGGVPPSTTTTSQMLNLSLAPGQTGTYGTGIYADGTASYYDITCTITANFDDPNASNNSREASSYNGPFPTGP